MCSCVSAHAIFPHLDAVSLHAVGLRHGPVGVLILKRRAIAFPGEGTPPCIPQSNPKALRAVTAQNTRQELLEVASVMGYISHSHVSYLKGLWTLSAVDGCDAMLP